MNRLLASQSGIDDHQNKPKSSPIALSLLSLTATLYASLLFVVALLLLVWRTRPLETLRSSLPHLWDEGTFYERVVGAFLLIMAYYYYDAVASQNIGFLRYSLVGRYLFAMGIFMTGILYQNSIVLVSAVPLALLTIIDHYLLQEIGATSSEEVKTIVPPTAEIQQIITLLNRLSFGFSIYVAAVAIVMLVAPDMVGTIITMTTGIPFPKAVGVHPRLCGVCLVALSQIYYRASEETCLTFYRASVWGRLIFFGQLVVLAYAGMVPAIFILPDGICFYLPLLTAYKLRQLDALMQRAF